MYPICKRLRTMGVAGISACVEKYPNPATRTKVPPIDE